MADDKIAAVIDLTTDPKDAVTGAKQAEKAIDKVGEAAETAGARLDLLTKRFEAFKKSSGGTKSEEFFDLKAIVQETKAVQNLTSAAEKLLSLKGKAPGLTASDIASNETQALGTITANKTFDGFKARIAAQNEENNRKIEVDDLALVEKLNRIWSRANGTGKRMAMDDLHEAALRENTQRLNRTEAEQKKFDSARNARVTAAIKMRNDADKEDFKFTAKTAKDKEKAETAAVKAAEEEKISSQKRLISSIERSAKEEAAAVNAAAAERVKSDKFVLKSFEDRVKREGELRREAIKKEVTLSQNQAANRGGNAYVPGPSAQSMTAGFGAAFSEGAARGVAQGASEVAKAQQDAAFATYEANVATVQNREANDELVTGLSNTRYALYDVANTFTIISAAATAAAVGPVVAAAQFEAAFASVARTSQLAQGEAKTMRREFEQLSTEIAVGFGDLTEIGTLAGQLGIPQNAIVEFTGVVAKFAATTDVAAGEAAKLIGRVAQLTGTPAGEYENLASAIYQTGVTSVATEGEILKMTSSIATAGDLAGLSNVEIVALSGSLASLGIQPEAARGSLQRIFNTLTVGAESGGESLTKLATITGMTEDAISDLWKNGADGSQQVFSAFIDGFSKMQDSGENTTQVLKDLGINAVRDQRAIQVLANNTEVYTKALNESANAYDNGTALADGYAVQTDNVSGTFTRLTNSLQALLAAVGESDGGLNNFLKILLKISTAVTSFIQSPLGGFFSAATLAIGAFVAVAAGSVALAARMRAAMLGMATGAQQGRTGLWTLTKQLTQVAAEFAKGTLTGGRFIAILNGVTPAAAAAGTGVRGLGAALAFAGNALKTFLPLAVLTVAITGFTMAFNAMKNAMKSDVQRAEDYFGDLGSLEQALKKDAKAIQEGAKVFGERTVEMESSITVNGKWIDSLSSASGAQVEMKDSLVETTEALREQSVQIGANALNAYKELIAGTEDFQKMWITVGPALEKNGFDSKAFFDQMVTDADNGVSRLDSKMKELESVINAGTFYAGGKDSAQYTDAAKNALWYRESLAKLKKEVQSMGDPLAAAASGLSLRNALGLDAADAAEEAARAQKELNGEWEEGDGAATQLAEAMKELLASTVGMAGNLSAVESGFYGLGKSLYENGKYFGAFTESGRANLNALESVVSSLATNAGDDMRGFAMEAGAAFALASQEGAVFGEDVTFISDILNSQFGASGPGWSLDFSSAAAREDIAAFIADAITAAEFRAQLERSRLKHATPEYAYDGLTGGVVAKPNTEASKALAEEEGRINDLRAFQKTINDRLASSNRNLKKGYDDATAGAKGNTKATKDNNKAKEEAIVTLDDYADVLKSIVSDANDWRFGVQKAKDALLLLNEETEKAEKKTWNFALVVEKAFNKINRDDTVRSVYLQYAEQADAARESIRKANLSISSLANEKTNLEYGLRIAEAYGDEARAAAIRQRLNEIDQESIELTKERTKAEQELNRTLVGDSAAAISNRSTVQSGIGTYVTYMSALEKTGKLSKRIVGQQKKDFETWAKSMGFASNELEPFLAIFDRFALTAADSEGETKSQTQTEVEARDAMIKRVEANQNYIDSLVRAGRPQKEINAAIAAGKKDVEEAGKGFGMSTTEIKKYTGAIGDYKTILDTVPKDVTTKLNFEPNTAAAETALARWKAAEEKKKLSVDVKLNTPTRAQMTRRLNDAMPPAPKPIKVTVTYVSNMTGHKGAQEALTIALDQLKRAGHSTSEYWSKRVEYWRKIVNEGSFASGGFTGRGGKYEYAGEVHKGEYVIPKQDVNQSTGLPYIMERATNTNTISNSPMFAGTIVVELSPTDRRLLSENGNVTVVVDGKAISNSVNNHNVTDNRRGSN